MLTPTHRGRSAGGRSSYTRSRGSSRSSGCHCRIHVSCADGWYLHAAAVPAQEAPTLTTIEEVEASIGALVGRLGSVDANYRAMLPARRTIEARCTDLELMYHAMWRHGQLSELFAGQASRPDIRIHVASPVLFELADGSLPFREAYATQRLRIDASMTDLLRLRALL